MRDETSVRRGKKAQRKFKIYLHKQTEQRQAKEKKHRTEAVVLKQYL